MNGFPQTKAQWDAYFIAKASLPGGPCPEVSKDWDETDMLLQQLIDTTKN